MKEDHDRPWAFLNHLTFEIASCFLYADFMFQRKRCSKLFSIIIKSFSLNVLDLQTAESLCL
jgi:hypothetical protein